jgi:hypothetical protein
MMNFCLAILFFFFVFVIIADHHGPSRINCWQDPMSPSKWKEEHVSLLHFYIIFYMLNVAKIYLFFKKMFILLFFVRVVFYVLAKGCCAFLGFLHFVCKLEYCFWSSIAASVD